MKHQNEVAFKEVNRAKSAKGLIHRNGYLVVTDVVANNNYAVRCDCGTTKLIRRNNFIRTLSCGCLKGPKGSKARPRSLDNNSLKPETLLELKNCTKQVQESVLDSLIDRLRRMGLPRWLLDQYVRSLIRRRRITEAKRVRRERQRDKFNGLVLTAKSANKNVMSLRRALRHANKVIDSLRAKTQDQAKKIYKLRSKVNADRHRINALCRISIAGKRIQTVGRTARMFGKMKRDLLDAIKIKEN